MCLFGIILLANTIFITYWGKYMFQALFFKILVILMRRKMKVLDDISPPAKQFDTQITKIYPGNNGNDTKPRACS